MRAVSVERAISEGVRQRKDVGVELGTRDLIHPSGIFSKGEGKISYGCA
jgi:hypothetical protein